MEASDGSDTFARIGQDALAGCEGSAGLQVMHDGMTISRNPVIATRLV